MQIIPAIEVRERKNLRSIAFHWQQEGAEYIHIYDPEGARLGKPAHLGYFRNLAGSLRTKLQYKGGVRREEDVEMLLEAGAGRVVLDECALADPKRCEALFEKYGERLIAAVRAQNGTVLLNNWPLPTNVSAEALLLRYRDYGLRTVLYKEMAEEGKYAEKTEQLRRVKEGSGLTIIASGGVRSLTEISTLKEAGLDGVVIYSALHDGSLSFKNAMAFAR